MRKNNTNKNKNTNKLNKFSSYFNLNSIKIENKLD